jgi:hypothetical protein
MGVLLPHTAHSIIRYESNDYEIWRYELEASLGFRNGLDVISPKSSRQPQPPSTIFDGKVGIG